MPCRWSWVSEEQQAASHGAGEQLLISGRSSSAILGLPFPLACLPQAFLPSFLTFQATGAPLPFAAG